MMNMSKFNTLENKLIKLKNIFMLLDKDVANLYEILKNFLLIMRIKYLMKNLNSILDLQK